METDWLLWVVAFLFFLPLHFGLPALYLLIQQGPGAVREKVSRLLLWGGISAVLGFTAALLLWPHSETWAAIAITITLIHPWFELMLRRRD